MRLFLFIFAFLSFPLCFAQTNSIEYFYKGRKGEAVPDFAALAVLDKQNCPLDIENEEQICTSRYKILRVLDTKSDALKKEYIEAKDKPMPPYYRHRPILIFGKHKNGILQIQGFEELREYFVPFNSNVNPIIYDIFYHAPILGLLTELYAFHSIGSPYYDLNNLDSIDMLFYNEYLVPYMKSKVKAVGKDFDELWRRLAKNRVPLKASKIKNDFAALGVIKSRRSASGSKRANLYELHLTIENVFKNDAKIDSNTAIFVDSISLPHGWGCVPLESLEYLRQTPFYFFGDLEDGSLVIKSLISPTQDTFVFGDMIYDISMGLTFEELIMYFLPANISLEEFKFGNRLKYLSFSAVRSGKITELTKVMNYMPECLRNDIREIAVKWEDTFNDSTPSRMIDMSRKSFFLGKMPILYFANIFRCRQYTDLRAYTLALKSNFFKSELELHICHESDLKGEGVWGRKW